MLRAAPPRTAIQPTGRRVVVVGGQRFSDLNFLPIDSFPIPGLGFDFVHFAATHPGFRRGFRFQRFTPIIPIGLPFFVGPTPQIVVVQQPPVIIMQPSGAVEEDGEPVRASRRTAPAQEAVPTPTPAPLREVGEFVLVRRDGGQLLAIGFSIEGNQVNYITREGIRRSVPLAELDVEATRRQNEERGTTVHLPARVPEPTALPPAPRQTVSL